MKVGVVSHLYPTPRQPEAGGFIRDQLYHLSRLVDIRLYSPLINRFWFDGGKFAIKPDFPVYRPVHPMLPLRFGNHLNDEVMALFMRWFGRGMLDECNLIHAHLAFPEACAAVRVYGGRKPIVVTVHGSDIHDFAQRPRLQAMIRDALNQVQGIIAVSDALVEQLAELGIEVPVRVIHNGIDTGRFTPGSKVVACKRLGLDPDRPRIMFAGRFIPVKNIEQLVRILPMLREKHPNLELVLLGAEKKNAIAAEIQAQIAATGVADMVRIEPMIPHSILPDWFRASDAFVLASRNEGFGLVLAEALACGRPVVATRSGGPESIIEAGTGMLVPHDNDRAFADAVLTTLASDGIFPSDELAESVRRRFSFETLARDIVSFYHEVV